MELFPADLLVCSSCGQALPPDQFHRESSRRTGRHKMCKPCRREHQKTLPSQSPEAVLARGRRWREANRERYDRAVKEHSLRSKYGIDLQEYARLLAAQEGRCAICRRPGDEDWDLSVDHCHTTGRVRGLLCRRCNAALGLLADDPVLLEQAASYLRRSR